MTFKILFLILFTCTDAVIYQLDDAQYSVMPPVVHLDPYQQCFSDPEGMYCTAFATFITEQPSSLFTQMQEFSKHKLTHYNHTRILFGKCIDQECKSTFGDLKDQELILEACLNRTMWHEYQLKVKVDEEVWCYKKKEKREVEAVDMLVVAVLLILGSLNVLGSFYDFCWGKPKTGSAAELLIFFSIQRNWKKLTSTSEDSDPRIDRLKGIYGFRGIFMPLVVVVHSPLPMMLLCGNPKFIEDQYKTYLIHILLNGTLIMQSFLFLSAFLMTYNFEYNNENRTVTWWALPRGILRRWLRLTPPYAVVLAVIATWYRHMGSGPAWGMLVTSEAESCRRHWWMHLLYINNYIQTSKCMPQAWYLAADTQLHILGMTIIVFCRSARSRKIVLSALFVIGMIIPALHTYYQDLDATVLITPTNTITLFAEDATFHSVYIRSHTNIPCFIMGVAFGYLVYCLLKKNFYLTKYEKWRPVYSGLFPMAIAMTIVCKVFYGEAPRMGVWWRVVIAALSKPVFGLLIALVIVGAILKIDARYRRVLEWRGWRAPGRASYAAYLLHAPIVRVYAGTITTPLEPSYSLIIQTGLVMVVITYVVASIFWVTVEAPLDAIAKCILKSRSSTPSLKKAD